MEFIVNKKFRHFILLCGSLAAIAFMSGPLDAQHLTLEGQTGGFLTPTAYVVPSANNHSFSMPAVGFHFIGASSVIGNVETISITEGFGNRFELGYTRSIHQEGNDANFSPLWSKQDTLAWEVDGSSPTISGMNVFHGKVVVVKENSKHFYTPGFAVGGVYRQGDHFVSGSLSDAVLGKPNQSYGNGDIYGAVTKTWAKPPVPLLINFGIKGTNAVILGLGGVSESWSARLFGGLGIPIPLGKNLVAVPSAGFEGQSSDIKNLNEELAAAGQILTSEGYAGYAKNRPHIPTTVDYAVRFTQIKNPHFSLDFGVGQVANNIGSLVNPVTGAPLPILLDARHVFGMGISYRP